MADDERTVRAGSVTLQAVLHSEIIVQALKAATNRERPNKLNGNGGFWDGGKSFPSGHAISSWAFAAAISDQYADKKWIGIAVMRWQPRSAFRALEGRTIFLRMF